MIAGTGRRRTLLAAGAAMVMFVAVSAMASPDLVADGWELARDEDGIRVWTREAPGRAIRAHRAETVVAAPLDRVRETVLDFDAHAEWAGSISESRAIERDGERLVWARTDLPFPVSDRDVVQRVAEREQAPDSVVLEFRAVPDAIPTRDGAVRIEDADSTWTIEAVDPERTRVVIVGHADPGGLVPAFVVDLFVVEGPFRTLGDLRRHLERRPG